jgi:uncharacterized protein YbjT (DUF2867 family)
MRVLMVGATGRYAHLVVSELVKRGVAVRALVRSEQRAEVARANGATDTVIGDLSDPRSLAAAVAGLDGVFHIGPAFAPKEGRAGRGDGRCRPGGRCAKVRLLRRDSSVHLGDGQPPG